jgi:hypothetical protein
MAHEKSGSLKWGMENQVVIAQFNPTTQAKTKSGSPTFSPKTSKTVATNNNSTTLSKPSKVVNWADEAMDQFHNLGSGGFKRRVFQA